MKHKFTIFCLLISVISSIKAENQENAADKNDSEIDFSVCAVSFDSPTTYSTLSIADAENPIVVVDNISYEVDLSVNEAYVTDNTTISISGGVKIADFITYEGNQIPVTKILDFAFRDNANIKGSLIIGKNIEKIGQFAFSGCEGLTGTLELPSSIKEIGWCSFQSCNGFTGTLILPESLTTIKGWAFNLCKGLTGNLTIPESITELPVRAFANCGFDGKLTLPNSLTSIGEYAFYNTPFTGELNLPSTLTSIGDYVFNSCQFTGGLTIPNSVTEIGMAAFADCSGFNGYLQLSSNLNIIGSYCFNGCSGFTGDLIIPDSVTEIGKTAFQNCSGLTGKLQLSSSLSFIDEWTFNKCGFTGSLIIPDGITSISLRAFANCMFNGNIKLPESLTSIGDYAFYSCDFEGDLTIPHSVTSLGIYTFYGCPFEGGTLILSKSMTEVPNYCFYYNRFNKVIIPESINRIGDYCFYNYYKTGAGSATNYYSYISYLICLPTTPPSVGNKAFYETTRGSIHFYYPSWQDGGYDKTDFWKAFGAAAYLNRRYNLEKLLTLNYDENHQYHYLYCGEDIDLTPIISPEYIGELFIENHFTWKVTNEGIIEIDNNNVATGIKAGVSEITATFGLLSINSLVGVFPSDGNTTGSTNTIKFNVTLEPSEQLDLNQYIINESAPEQEISINEAKNYQWTSSDNEIVSISDDGKCTALKFGSCNINVKSEGKILFTFQIFVSPRVSIEYSDGNTSYSHHVIYNSTPSFYIAAPNDYEIISVEHDGADVTEAVLANEGYYTPASPITENSTIKVSLLDTRDPSDLNGDGVVDVSDLNFLIERIMNNN